MDFLDPKKKKQHTIRLFVGYVLVGIVILLTSSFLVLEANGYFYDTKTHSVIKNGLIFVDSAPESATVYVNGKRQDTTDARMVLPEGKYDIEVRREGYRTWKLSVQLEGGSIERLVYPFLFPQNPTLANVKPYASEPKFSTQSPDRRWVIIQSSPQSLNLDLFDLSTERVSSTTLSLPANVASAKPSSNLSLQEWSTDNKHVLLKHSFSGGQEYLMIDREDITQSSNLTSQLPGVAISDVALRDKKFDQFYLYNANGGILSSFDNRSSLPIEILRNVVAFKAHGANVLAYVNSVDGRYQLIIREDEKDYTIRELQSSKKYLVDLARFDNHWYLVVSGSDQEISYIYKDPVANVKRNNLLIAPLAVRQSSVQFVSFSQNTRFIAMQSTSGMAVYDIETQRLIRYSLPFNSNSKYSWMDGHRLYGFNNTKLTIFDFDGNNKQEIIDSSTNHQPLFNRDYHNLFTLGQYPINSTSFSLRNTPLKLKL